jgi:N-acetyltransferase 10
LEKIQDDLAETQPVGSLVKLAKTLDQARAILTFVDAIAEKTLQSTVTLTAARGRGKSAALGVAVAAAVAHGYSNIFITSPHPDNLKTLFEFIFKGFDALNYLDHVDYSIIQSTNPDFNKAIVRVNIHRTHRQTIQYIQPQDAHVLGQAELVVIDEAAAIPLPLVRKLIGPYLVFMASTINGYEGTGRSLSLKLIQQLREQSHGSSKSKDSSALDRSSGKLVKESGSSLGRTLREITLSEPIRYAPGDSVEKWLNTLLCLDATLPRSSRLPALGCPHPSKCDLLIVNRDTLFSFHPVSEKFLQQMMALYVASHYKNSPNDLQLMSDAPAHQLYVLVPPVEEEAEKLPEPLCVIQVALEGQISRESVMNSLSRGQRAAGDLIPWLISQQFQDEEFAGLSGARVVRIATNPEYIGMGYGSRALQLLIDFYEGRFLSLDEGEVKEPEEMVRVTDEELEMSTLLQDNVKVRDIHTMPPLFARLSERRPPQLDYVGVSYGLTQQLFKFWNRASFVPVYLRQTSNDLTGEHTCVMLRKLVGDSGEENVDSNWLGAFAKDFHKRFLELLSYQFRDFPAVTSLTIDQSAAHGEKLDESKPLTALTKEELDKAFSPFDLKRLDKYADQMIDYHLILDLLPTIATLYFSGRLKQAVSLSRVQQAILLAVGLQRKRVEDMERELELASSQVLGLFVKVMRKFSAHFRSLVEGAIGETMPDAPELLEANGAHEKMDEPRRVVVKQSLDDELAEAGAEIDHEEKERMRAMIDALPLERYEIADGGKAEWQGAERQIASGKSSTVSIKMKRPDEGKRKTGGAFAEAVKEADESRERKKSKKAKR